MRIKGNMARLKNKRFDHELALKIIEVNFVDERLSRDEGSQNECRRKYRKLCEEPMEFQSPSCF